MEASDLMALARFGRKQPASGSGGMAITSHPLVTDAAVRVLRGGGNAADAALAAAATQVVVEPHMTTITGVLSMLYYDARTGSASYVNGGMNAPLALDRSFAATDVNTGKGVPVPGWWAGFEGARERFGTLGRGPLMEAGIAYARDGFPVYPFLYGEMFTMGAVLGRSAQGREIFFRDGALLAPGETLRQKRAAGTLERLRDEGSDHFYRGDFARSYVDVVREAGGIVTPEDLAGYRARIDEPVRGTYRGWQLIAAAPPDTGGTHLIEAFNMLELLDLKAMGHQLESADTLWYLMRISEEVRIAGGAQGDPRFHPLPLDVILSKEYAAMRLELLRMSDPSPVPAAPPGTNHINVVDGEGNVASLIHSCVCQPWSNGLFCDGFMVTAGGIHYLRRLPDPGGRVNLFLAPGLFLENGRPLLAVGSPSVAMLTAIVQNAVNVLDFGMDLEASVHLPRFGTAWGASAQAIEVDVPESLRGAVVGRGMKVEVTSPWHFTLGSFEGIHVDPGTAARSACGDPRRNSHAMTA